MKSRIPAVLLALTLALTSPLLLLAQSNNPAQSAANVQAQDWQDLQYLEPGKKILVEFKSNVGDAVEGKFVSAVGTKLTLSSDGYTRSLEQRDIQGVYRVKGRWSRGRTARIGMGIGMLVGAAVSAGKALGNEKVGTLENDGTPGYGGFFLGAFAGAGVGALLGGKRKGQLLYESK